MTQRGALPLILKFSLPFILCNLFQKLLGGINVIIAGQSIGVSALAAIGVGSWPVWMLGNIVAEFASACCIQASNLFGRRDAGTFQNSVYTMLWVSGLLALLLGAGMLLFLNDIVSLLLPGPEVADKVRVYLAVYAGGTVFLVLFSVSSALLSAVGNNRAPFFAVLSAAAINVALSLVFVRALRWGVAGAAAATVLSQGIAAGITVTAIVKNPLFRLRREDRRFSMRSAGELFRLSLPMMAQGVIIASGGFMVQRAINRYGSAFIAGLTASDQIVALAETIAVSLRTGTSVFVGQNLGAGHILRIRRAVRHVALLSVAAAAVIGAGCVLSSGRLPALFISGDDPALAGEALRVAGEQLRIAAAGLPVMFAMYILRISLQTMGNTVLPMLAGLVQCAARLGAAYLLTRQIGSAGLYYSEVSAWTVTLAMVGVAYALRVRKLLRNERMAA